VTPKQARFVADADSREKHNFNRQLTHARVRDAFMTIAAGKLTSAGPQTV